MKQLYGIPKSRTTPYHPAGNGRVERMNQILLNMLRALEAEKDKKKIWCHEHLPELLQAYNNTVHSATGFAAYYLMFGQSVRLPVGYCMHMIWLAKTYAKLPSRSHNTINPNVDWQTCLDS